MTVATSVGRAGTPFPFSTQDFDRIAAILRADSGIHLEPAKQPLVYSRLVRRLRALSLASFGAYCDFVESKAGDAERREMLNALTTNVTRFFREPHHFDHLRQHVLPGVAAAARAGKRVRLWSAACSTGQEPFSMALTVLSAIPEAADLDIRILATDIDEVVLEHAKAATYSNEMLADIPPGVRGKWLTSHEDGTWSFREQARRLVAFRQLNLIGNWPMREHFHAILCRNVAIYFDHPTQAALWDRFAGRLATDGVLYIGHSERILSPRFRTDGLTTYRLTPQHG